MAQNYTRQSSFSDGDTITASLFNDEYNQLVNAFTYSSTSASSTGHRHDGSAGQGGNIFKIGDIDFLNKIEVDSTNNRLGFYVEVSSAAVEQIRIQDGSVIPVTTNDIDLGTSSLQFKDLYIDGTANVDSLTLTSGSTVTTILDEDDLSSDSATALVTQQSVKAYVDAQVTAQDFDFQADSGGALNIDLDTETMTFTGGTGIDTSGSGNAVTFDIDSTVATLTGTQTLTNKTLTSPDVNTPDIDGGTIDGTVIGGTTPAAVSATTVSATGNITVGGTVDGRDVATDGTKLDGIEALADVTDTTNVTAAGAVMDSELTNETAVKSLDQGVATTDTPTFAGLTTTADVSFGDNDKAIFGAGSDLEIYHDGSNSYIKEKGNGVLNISGGNAINFLTGNDAAETGLTIGTDGAVTAYYDNAAKLTTTSTGIDVTGTVVSDGLTVSASPLVEAASAGIKLSETDTTDLNSLVYNNGGIFRVSTANDAFSSFDTRFAIDHATGDISFYEDTGTTAKLTWDASDEALEFADNAKATFGAGSDLQIYHTGTNSIIKNLTGEFLLQGDGITLRGNSPTETMLTGDVNGAITLHYDSLAKLATTSTGIDVTGSVTADDVSLNTKAVIGGATPRIELFESDTTDVNTRIRNTGGELQIQSTDDAGTISKSRIVIDHATGDISFREDTGSTAKLYWDASEESLGIGTTSPAEALHVAGNIRFGDTAPSELYTNSSELRLGVDKNNDNDTSNITFYANDSEKVRIDKDGHLIVPNGLTLGVAVDAYAASNTLDDYEEGTFTPELADASSGGNTATTSSATGAYTKVGNLAVLNMRFTNINTTGLTGANTLFIRGLPFTNASLAQNQSEGSVRMDLVDVPTGSYSATFATVANATYGSVRVGVDNSNDVQVKVQDISSGSSDIFITIQHFV